MSSGSLDTFYHSIHQHTVIESESRPPDSLAPPEVLDPQTRWIYFILGCCVLLPWNVMITATPYFLSRLDGSSVKMVFISYLSVTFTASRFIFLAHATVVSKSTSSSRQIRRSILGLIILCFLLTMSTYFPISARAFAMFVLTIGASQAAIESYLQTSVVAVASLYGPQALQAMMSGQAAVAVVVSSVQVLSSAMFIWKSNTQRHTTEVAGQANTESATRVFFALSTLFLIISALAHNTLVSKANYKIFIAPLEQPSVPRREIAGTEHLLAAPIVQESYSSQKHRIVRVAKTNITFEVAVAYVFIVTLAVFPPITASVQPTNPAIHPLLFNTIHFLVFNLGDLLGRYICSIPILIIWSAKWLAALSFSRTLFIPIFLLCNIQSPSSNLPTTPIITSDLFFMLILLAFGVSNGYVSSLCMMSAPSLDHNQRLENRKEDVDVAATIVNFSLVAGLALGSIASFAVMSVVCGCNPFSHSTP